MTSAQDIVLRTAEGAADMAHAATLFQEYAASLEFDLDYQGFDDELADLPGAYAAPRGAIVLAFVGGELAGAVALRPHTEDTCEMKRLFIRPDFRGLKLGRRLTVEILRQAATKGYRAIRLDTVADAMSAATALYRSLGFYEIEAYYDSPISGTVYFERKLEPGTPDG